MGMRLRKLEANRIQHFGDVPEANLAVDTDRAERCGIGLVSRDDGEFVDGVLVRRVD